MEKKNKGTFYEYQRKKIEAFVEETFKEWKEAFINLNGRKPTRQECLDGILSDFMECGNWFDLSKEIQPTVPPKKLTKIEKTRQYLGTVLGDTFAAEAEIQLGNI